MATFAERLNAAMIAGQLTVADLQRWFCRPYPTVRTWCFKGHEPWGPAGDDAQRDLALLEHLIASKYKMPVPSNLTQIERIIYINELRNECRAGISKARAAE